MYRAERRYIEQKGDTQRAESRHREQKPDTKSRMEI